MSREVVQEAVFPVAIERLWQALTDPTALARWLAPNDFQPLPGRQFWLRFPREGNSPEDVHCTVIALEPPRLLAFTWSLGAGLPLTLVTFTLEAAAGGTRLRLVQSGFPDHQGSLADRVGAPLGAPTRLPQRSREGVQPVSRFFHYQVDEEALIDGIYAFVMEQNTSRRNALPIARELQEGPNFLIPFDVLETMVLDGLDQRKDVADYVHYVVQRVR